MQKVIFLVVFLFSFFSLAQIEDPVDWFFSVEETSDNNVNLIINAEIEKGWRVYSQNIDGDGPIPTSFQFFGDSLEFNLLGEVQESNAITKFDLMFEMELSYFENSALFKQKVSINNSINFIKGELEFMVCNDVMCLPPDYVDMVFELKKKDKLESAKESLKLANQDKYIIPTIDLNNPLGDCGEKKSEQSLWGVFLLGIIGGFIALLTPCVFPMIPLTVSFFTKGADNRSKAIYNALLYGLFIFLTYTLLSLPFHLIPNINPEVLNQISTSPILNVIFFIIFTVFAFSFFGYYELTLPSKWSTSAGTGSNMGGVLGIFFMALTLAIVSFSCTGPILGSLLAGTLSSATADSLNLLGFDIAIVSAKLTLAMAGFGIALGLPFALFAAFPTWLNSLPKSGGWLNTVKVVLGFLEIALAIKFLSNADLVEQWGFIKREVFFALWVITFSGLLLYILGFITFPHDTPNAKLNKTKISFACLITGFIIYLFPGVIGQDWWSHKLLSGFPPPKYYAYLNHDHNIKNIFHNYDEGIEYAKANNKPIMIDFTGWACVNCRKIEDDVWSEKEVERLLNDKYVVISLYVDEKTLLPEDKQEIVEIITKDGEVKKKKIRRVGDKWSTLQSLTFANNSQPLHVVVNPNGELLGNPIGYSYARDSQNYINYLKCGLDAFLSSKNNNLTE